MAMLIAIGPIAVCIASTDDPRLDSPDQKQAPTAFAAANPRPVLQWGTGDGRSYLVPGYEIFGYEILLNRFDHYVSDPDVYSSPIDNLRTNLHRKWVVDNDKFSTNQFLHPYEGAIYQGFARSAGLGFWQSMGYASAGSLLWEEAGESTAPSINDQVATGIGGVFLGEPLFRIASLLLESNQSSGRSPWRELAAAAISPPTAFNRWVFGNRFDGVFRSNDPAVFTRVDVGATLSAHYSSNVNINPDLTGPPASQTLQRHVASAAFDMDYGLPGKPGYGYKRPFDYFHFEFGADTSNIFETIFSRGLLYGTPFELGANQRGVWGLYGSYDYFAPQVFRVSSTAVSVGGTSQWWLSRTVALQGSALAGLGYGAGGVIHGRGVTRPGTLGEGQRNYHYGATPQELVAARLIFGDRAAIDANVRDYYISHIAATESTGSEDIFRAELALTVRVYNLHGITLRYAESRRDGRYAHLPSSLQRLGTISIGYTLLGHSRFGAVDWRPDAAEDP